MCGACDRFYGVSIQDVSVSSVHIRFSIFYIYIYICLHLSAKVYVPIMGMSNSHDSFQMSTWVFPIVWTIGPRMVYILSTLIVTCILGFDSCH